METFSALLANKDFITGRMQKVVKLNKYYYW